MLQERAQQCEHVLCGASHLHTQYHSRCKKTLVVIFSLCERMSDVALSMRVGLLRLEGRTLSADTRKGILEVISSPPARLVWVAESSRTNEEVRVPLQGVKVVLELLPGPQRALCLRKNGERSAFFWMQEPDTSDGADERRVAGFNALIERLCSTSTEEKSLPALVSEKTANTFNNAARKAESELYTDKPNNAASASFLARLNAFDAGSSQALQQNILDRVNAVAASSVC